MAANMMSIFKRDAASAPISHTMITLLTILLIILILTLLLCAALFFMRNKKKQNDLLPVWEEKRLSTSSISSHHRRVMVRPSESVYIYEKQKSSDSQPPSPTSPIPEIRITFPEEYDDAGKRKSGRVVVVRVGETSIGLEPVGESDEKLPSYGEDERFQSLDLDRIGGLVEKARNNQATWKEVQ